MWNRRKEDETPSRPTQAPSAPASTPVQQPRETQPPMSSMPMRSYESSAVGGSATIGKAVMVKGQIFSREDLVIDGEVEGTVEAQEHRVTIGPNGKVQADVKAREIIILGGVNGNVEAADKIDIRKEARLVGDIKTSRIVIEDGAYFKGSIDIVKADAKPARSPERTERPAPAPSVSPSAPAAAPGK